jgi:DNA invertase Pin-like site-specific DNA recombinase
MPIEDGLPKTSRSPEAASPAKPLPKAYSYLRFSTPDQMEGDSFRRQWKLAKSYAERNGLDLDHELKFHDFGVPGFRGANVERGKLKAFRRAVEDEVVPPGSYLLVEDFDRLSRMDPWDAFPIFQEIINNDITIVTLKDGKEWSKAELRGNTFRLMEPLFAMWNSHNESAKKSMRLSEVHAAKRKRLFNPSRWWNSPSAPARGSYLYMGRDAPRCNTIRSGGSSIGRSPGSPHTPKSNNRKGPLAVFLKWAG